VAGSDRYQWWVLWTVPAGLLSVTITFNWTSTGPLLAFGVAAPVFGKLGDIGGYLHSAATAAASWRARWW
jgi:hypothetical protein